MLLLYHRCPGPIQGNLRGTPIDPPPPQERRPGDASDLGLAGPIHHDGQQMSRLDQKDASLHPGALRRPAATSSSRSKTRSAWFRWSSRIVTRPVGVRGPAHRAHEVGRIAARWIIGWLIQKLRAALI